MRRAALLVAVSALALTGCKSTKPSSDEKKVTVSSTDDATAPVVDHDYRFRLAWPGEGWKLFHEADARKLAPDAVAGISRGGQSSGVVIVEEAPGLEVSTLARLIVDNMGLEGKTVELFEETSFAGKEAIRFVVTGRMREIPLRYVGRVFIHQDHGYQVLAWGVDGQADDDDFAPIFAAFSLEEGAVTSRAAPREVVDAHGVGWRLANGVYENAANGLVLRPEADWRVVIGGELSQMNSEAEVGMVSSAPEAYLLMLVKRIPGVDPETYRAQQLRAFTDNLGFDFERDEWSAEVDGTPRSFTRLRVRDQPPLEYVHGVVVHGDWAIQLTGWYMSALRTRAEPAMVSGLASLSFLDEAERARLARELAEEPDRQNRIGAGISLRDGVYRDFVRGLRWQRPEGMWSVEIGQEARAVNPIAQVFAEEERLGLQALIVSEDAHGQDAASYHDAVIASLSPSLGFTPHRRAARTRIGTGAALVTAGLAEGGSLRLYYRVTTAVAGDRAVQVHVWAPEGAVTGADAAIDAVAANLHIEPDLVETDDSKGVYRDHRLGFAMRAPTGWKRSNETPEAVAGLGSTVSWEGAGGRIDVLALCLLDAGQDEAWFLDYIEQIARTRTDWASGEPERVLGELAGRDARHLRWAGTSQRFDILLATHGRTFFAIMVSDASGDDSTLTAAQAGFSIE